MNGTLCDLRGVDKSFGDNRVLKQLNLSLPAGSVTVLMGANGAGKSTLVKILSGVHALDSGSITLLGKDFRPSTPSEAIRAGVVTVHQNINDGVIPDLDVASNLLIDRLAEPSYGFFLRRRQNYADAERIASQMGSRSMCAVGGRARTSSTAGCRHSRGAMAHDPQLLILDEPTSRCRSEGKNGCFCSSTVRPPPPPPPPPPPHGRVFSTSYHRMSVSPLATHASVDARRRDLRRFRRRGRLDYEGAVQAICLGHRYLTTSKSHWRAGQAVLESAIFKRQAPKPGHFHFTLCEKRAGCPASTGTCSAAARASLPQRGLSARDRL